MLTSCELNIVLNSVIVLALIVVIARRNGRRQNGKSDRDFNF